MFAWHKKTVWAGRFTPQEMMHKLLPLWIWARHLTSDCSSGTVLTIIELWFYLIRRTKGRWLPQLLIGHLTWFTFKWVHFRPVSSLQVKMQWLGRLRSIFGHRTWGSWGMTPCRRRGTWVSVLEPALPGNSTYCIYFIYMDACFFMKLFVTYSLVLHGVASYGRCRCLEMFGWRMIWIDLGCGVRQGK